jgi:hypothetical protein
MLDSGFQMAQSKIVYFISRQRLNRINSIATNDKDVERLEGVKVWGLL